MMPSIEEFYQAVTAMGIEYESLDEFHKVFWHLFEEVQEHSVGSELECGGIRAVKTQHGVKLSCSEEIHLPFDYAQEL